MPVGRPVIGGFCAAVWPGTAPPMQVESSGSAPAIRPSSSAQSCAVRANGPTVSSECDSGIAPAGLTRPTGVLNPVTPQKCAGIRIEPPVSEPSAANVTRAATAEPDPDDEPPVTCGRAKGLCTGPKWALWPVGP